MGYIRMDKDLQEDPRVLRLAAELTDVDQDRAVNEILGGLYRLWRYADTYLELDSIQVRYHVSVKVTGLPLQVLKKFPLQWLRDDGNGTLTLPNYSVKNALLDKESRREATRKRVERWRMRKRNAGNALLKRKSNKSKRNTAVTTGTGTGTTVPETETGASEACAAPSPSAQRASAQRQATEGNGETHHDDPDAKKLVNQQKEPWVVDRITGSKMVPGTGVVVPDGPLEDQRKFVADYLRKYS